MDDSRVQTRNKFKNKLKMILDLLEKSEETKSLIGLNFYGSGNGFYCGYVLQYNDEFIIIQHYSKFGVNDGIIVHKIADIQYFESDTVYLKGIKLLIENQDIIQRQTYSPIPNKNIIESFAHLFESFLGNKDFLLKFELTDDEIYFGFIEWCDENCFSTILVDNDGLVIGKSIFKFDDLKVYWIDDLECRKRYFFYKIKNIRN